MVSLNPRQNEYNGEVSTVGTVQFDSYGNLTANSNGTPQQWCNVSFSHNGRDFKTSARIMGSNVDKLSSLTKGDILFVSLEEYNGELMIDALALASGDRISIEELGDIFATSTAAKPAEAAL